MEHIHRFADNAVLRDLEWTGSIELEQTFKENVREDEDIHRQYIGTMSGLTRLFPGSSIVTRRSIS